MAIPSQTDMFRIVLDLFADGREYTNRAVRDKARRLLDLTEEDIEQTTSSGIPTYESRTNWGITYLARAGLINRVSRGTHKISEKGIQYLSSNLTGADFSASIREIIDNENPWNRSDDNSVNTSNKVKAIQTTTDNNTSPEEQIGLLSKQMNDFLAHDLLNLILERDSSFFEQLVVDLIEKLGYGKGKVTQKSCDCGIDGLITTDILGFNSIYVQAKRYAPENKVSRPLIQGFIGALNGATNGVFITTSSFTNEAVEYATNHPNVNVALIDGQKLTDLMIKYNLGISTERIIEIKRIDLDYFNQ